MHGSSGRQHSVREVHCCVCHIYRSFVYLSLQVLQPYHRVVVARCLEVSWWSSWACSAKESCDCVLWQPALCYCWHWRCLLAVGMCRLLASMSTMFSQTGEQLELVYLLLDSSSW